VQIFLTQLAINLPFVYLFVGNVGIWLQLAWLAWHRSTFRLTSH